MSNTFTIIGDPHLTHKSIDRVSQICQKVETLGNRAIWLGDLLDTKEVIRGKCQNFWLEYFSNSKLDHWVIVGNHDYFNLDCQDHSLQFLKALPNVTVVDKPMDFINTPFYMIPYIHDQKELKEALKAGPKDSILIGHLELKGFDYGNGHICEEGITTRSLKQYKKVISGHFHKYQEKDNLIYLGAPFSHSFGESNQDKWLMIYDTDSDTMDLVNTMLPMHRTVTLNCDELYENSGDRMEHWLEFMDDKEHKHFWRYILTGKQENINKFPTKMYLDSELNIKFITRPTDSALNNVEIKDTSSNQEQFSQWAKEIRGMSEETTKLGLDIMEAVRAK